MKLKVLFTFLAVVIMTMATLPLKAQQKEAYVVVSNNGTMITFYYDLQKANREGTVCQIEGTSPAWIGTLTKPNTQIVTAEFDKSFQEYRPKRTWRWFFNCSALKEIKGMENLNTSETTEMVGMFSGCKALTSLNLSKFDTSMADNINNMFMECEALTSLDLSNFNTEKVTSMSYLFAGCKALESLNLSSFNTKNVRTMGDMFAGCANMTKIDVTFLNTESVSDMKGMFSGCSKLTSIDLSKFNTERVSRMNAMFKGCKSLTSIDLSTFKTTYVRNMDEMFFDCQNLTTLDLTKFDTCKTTSFDDMFGQCKELNTIYCNDKWNCPDPNNKMFDGCEKLKGAVAYNKNSTGGVMANPETGYFTRKTSDGIASQTTSHIATIKAIYSASGQKLNELQRGLNIVRMSDGTMRKVLK
jgi:hypothetical protein